MGKVSGRIRKDLDGERKKEGKKEMEERKVGKVSGRMKTSSRPVVCVCGRRC